jgi:hypothetical protein
MEEAIDLCERAGEPPECGQQLLGEPVRCGRLFLDRDRPGLSIDRHDVDERPAHIDRDDLRAHIPSVGTVGHHRMTFAARAPLADSDPHGPPQDRIRTVADIGDDRQAFSLVCTILMRAAWSHVFQKSAWREHPFPVQLDIMSDAR